MAMRIQEKAAQNDKHTNVVVWLRYDIHSDIGLSAVKVVGCVCLSSVIVRP